MSGTTHTGGLTWMKVSTSDSSLMLFCFPAPAFYLLGQSFDGCAAALHWKASRRPSDAPTGLLGSGFVPRRRSWTQLQATTSAATRSATEPTVDDITAAVHAALWPPRAVEELLSTPPKSQS